MYPRIKNTAHKVVYAFQCSRGDSGRPGKGSSIKAWLKGARVRTVPGGADRPQAQCGGLLPLPRGRRAGQHQFLGPPGQRPPQANGVGCQAEPLRLGWPGLALRGQRRRHPRSRGLQGQPKRTLRSPWLSQPFSGRSGRAGLSVSWVSESSPGLAIWYSSPFPVPSPALYHLTQNDPHRRVCLDGEAQCFQGAKGWVHFSLCHTLVERAWGSAAMRGCPKTPASPLTST